MKAAWHPAAGLAPTAAGITIAAQPLMACLAESRSRPSGSLHQSQVRCEPLEPFNSLKSASGETVGWHCSL